MAKVYSLQRKNKYTNLRFRNFLIRTAIKGVIYGVPLFAIGTAFINYVLTHNDGYSVEYDEENIEDDYVRVVGEPIDAPLYSTNYSNELEVSTIKVSNELDYRQELLKEYCAIYQIDYDIVYNRLCELTNNFTSYEYLDGRIPGVTFKKMEAKFDTDEALLLAYARCCEQMPEQVGLTDNIDTGIQYVTNLTYEQQISKFADIFDVDKCLVYAIIRSETGFSSNLSDENNNLGNLKGLDGWMSFDNSTQSIIEICAEIRKFNNMGFYSIEEIGSVYAPEADGNENWVPNVTEIYEYANANYVELFISTSEGIKY